jgi:TrmH RNA methyltransferase
MTGEMKVYGRNACLALWQNRAVDIIRIYVVEARLKEFGPLLKWCAREKKAYHVVSPDDLAKVAQSVHHEGVMILAREPRRLRDEDLASRVQALTGPACLVYLDGVGNPHNVGSIVRVGAHFGVPLVLGRAGQLPRLAPAAVRIAEGAVEHVPFLELQRPETAFELLRKAGFSVVATSSHAPASLYGGPLPARSVIVLGGETGGASDALLKAADYVLQVPGTGAVESLNVSIAAGLVLGEYWRRHRSGG